MNLNQPVKILRLLILLIGTVLLIHNAPAKAALMTYNYTSCPFTSINYPELGPNINGTIEVDIAPSYSGNFNMSDCNFFSFTAGSLSINKSNAYDFVGSFDFTNGEIDTWSCQLYIYDPNLIYMNSNIYQIAINKYDENLNYIGGNFGEQWSGCGTWTRASIAPLPSAALLLATGLIGLSCLRSRFKKA